jgi:hypothetical protein
MTPDLVLLSDYTRVNFLQVYLTRVHVIFCGIHSCRSAASGSILDARLAGT